MDDLLQEFVAETRETLEALSGEIVLWEAAPADRARLDAIFRFVHTVKGSCGFLDLPRLGALAHAAEDVLQAVREGRRVPDTALVDAVLAIVDRIGELTEEIDAGTASVGSSDDLLIAALAEAVAPAAAPAIDHAPAGPARTVARSVRLGVELLDRMMLGMSEMVLARNELARRLRDDAVDPRVEAALERLSATVAEMRDTVTRTRMQRIDTLFSAMPRMVRDAAASLGKQVMLEVTGQDVELDREMIELLRDPLVHIVRNAVDHGLEGPADRRAANKPEAGRLAVCARQTGNQILIEIEDDGRGIDVDRLVAKARAAGLHTEADLARMDEDARLDLALAPGLSSRDVVTALSGRGVGMDVVRANIEQIGGRIQLRNRPGRGLTIVLQVPLTLSIIPAILVGIGGQRFGVPRQSIEEIVSLGADTVRIDALGDGHVATVRGRRLPLVCLGKLFGLPGTPTVLVIVATRGGEYALAVDLLLDAEELVAKPAAPAVMATGLYAGQSLPDTGEPLLLLDATGIAAAAGVRFPATPTRAEAAVAPEPRVPALLFEDLDGRRRAVALAAIDRIEAVPAAAVAPSGGRLHLIADGRLTPVLVSGDLPATATLTVLRLSDGETEIAYAVAAADEIVDLPPDLAPARGRAGVLGVAAIGGTQVEVLDPHALFAGEMAPAALRPLCLLAGDDTGWMETFLRPVLEAAGYRCAATPPPGETPAVTLAMDRPPAGASGPVLTLSRRPGEGGIYRYDRAALVAALAETTGQAA